MKIEAMIRIMQEYSEGKPLECKVSKNAEWVNIIECVPSHPMWDWESCQYRIKPEPEPQSLEDRIKAEYSDKEVVMLEWTFTHYDPIESLTFDIISVQSIEYFAAQGIKGFHGYVYKRESHFDGITFEVDCTPSCYFNKDLIHPIAVLFEVSK